MTDGQNWLLIRVVANRYMLSLAVERLFYVMLLAVETCLSFIFLYTCFDLDA